MTYHILSLLGVTIQKHVFKNILIHLNLALCNLKKNNKIIVGYNINIRTTDNYYLLQNEMEHLKKLAVDLKTKQKIKNKDY